MWENENFIEYKGYYHKLMSLSGLRVFRGKAVSQMTEQESKEAHQFIWKNTGTLYFSI